TNCSAAGPDGATGRIAPPGHRARRQGVSSGAPRAPPNGGSGAAPPVLPPARRIDHPLLPARRTESACRVCASRRLVAAHGSAARAWHAPGAETGTGTGGMYKRRRPCYAEALGKEAPMRLAYALSLTVAAVGCGDNTLMTNQDLAGPGGDGAKVQD